MGMSTSKLSHAIKGLEEPLCGFNRRWDHPPQGRVTDGWLDLSEDARAPTFAGHSLRACLASSAEVDERYVQK